MFICVCEFDLKIKKTCAHMFPCKPRFSCSQKLDRMKNLQELSVIKLLDSQIAIEHKECIDSGGPA